VSIPVRPANDADLRGPNPAQPVWDRQLVRDTSGLLAIFNAAGVLGPADVHTAQGVCRIGRAAGLSTVGAGSDPAGQDRAERVRLALALAVRALRMGSVCVDLTTVAETAFDEAEELIDVSGLPWPDPTGWLDAVRASPLVTLGPDGSGDRPLRLVNGLLYLERYWAQEEQVRAQLVDRRSAAAPAVSADLLAGGLARIFGPLGTGDPDLQRLAAAVSATSWVTVLAGGPGTGKTTTVARLLALVREQDPRARIALAAPTGKAAARLEEAVRSAGTDLPVVDAERLGELTARTLHRLLGWRPDARSRFRFNADNHLPFEVVVVDEMSMVSLTMMARLTEAIRPDARLVLVGDPDQLSSVEAGAVMADITGADLPDRPDVRGRLDAVGATGADQRATHGVVHLRKTWRFGRRIGALATAIRLGDADQVIDLLTQPAGDAGPDDPTEDRIEFTEIDLAAISGPAARLAGTEDQSAVAAVRRLQAEVVDAGRALHTAAIAGDIPGALTGLEQHRLLCAHRIGPFGVARWSREVESWLIDAIPGYGQAVEPGQPGRPVAGTGRSTGPPGRYPAEWYPGRPVLVNANDYEVQLYNGDTGVVVQTPDGLRAAFARGGDPLLFAPVRLDQVQTVHAMTVHRAQGSQFQQVSFIVPPVDSPLLTRELLYTAVTRASQVVRVLGSTEAIRRAVGRPANRASGLRARLR